MSLVNEALKKARLEAERQRAANRGVPMPQMDAPAERRRGFPALLAALAGAALALTLVAILLWVGRPRAAETAAANVPSAATDTGENAAGGAGESARAPRTEPAAAAATTTDRGAASESADPADSGAADRAAPPATANRDARATPAADEPPPAVATGSTGRATTATPPAAAGQGDNTARTTAPRPTPEAPAAAAEPRPAAPVPATAEPAPAAPTRRTFVREAELADARLELSGIAWGAQPFALINGRVVAPGDRVEGYAVVAIEPREVELSGSAGSIVIRLQ